jgi:hypothetical protein
MENNTILDVANEIRIKINAIKDLRSKCKEYADNKANKTAIYDKQMAVTIIQLKNGKEFQFENEIIKEPVNTLIDKIARGICWKDKLEMDKAEGEWRALLSNIECAQTELMGLQSIFKYLDKV